MTPYNFAKSNHTGKQKSNISGEEAMGWIRLQTLSGESVMIHSTLEFPPD